MSSLWEQHDTALMSCLGLYQLTAAKSSGKRLPWHDLLLMSKIQLRAGGKEGSAAEVLAQIW